MGTLSHFTVGCAPLRKVAGRSPRRALAATRVASVVGHPHGADHAVLPRVRDSLVLRVVAQRKLAGRSRWDECRAR